MGERETRSIKLVTSTGDFGFFVDSVTENERMKESMNHSERKIARRFDEPYRSHTATDIVYSGKAGTMEALRAAEKQFYPAPSEYKVYFGELHGHTSLSDGGMDPEMY